MATKTTSKTAASPSKRGNMKPAEIKPLIMAARKAYDRQLEAGLVDDRETFDAWRHTQCLATVGRPGITACNHGDFRPLLAHFQTLAGDDASAFHSLMKTGQPTDHAAPGDTHEARRILIHHIADALTAHHHLATAPEPQLLQECVDLLANCHPGVPWESTSGPAAFEQLLARKAAIAAKGKGPISVGYVVYLIRQKTRRPDLTLGRDWQAGLADRCTVSQLTQIRDTVINRIAATEGIGRAATRNKSQRSPKARAAHSPKTLAPRPGTDFQ